ncbi:cytochrome c biogenesis CcdA family protein [Microbacterium sp.]|uniref:cytochrome c biogenesis CcdA family protein n=1 Tax=Microbacterium sp. TaxID=51671 RepID=UPI003A93FA3A
MAANAGMAAAFGHSPGQVSDVIGGAVGFAFVLGMVALFNPCGFPLLGVYLAAFVGGGTRSAVDRVTVGARAGLALTLGFVAVFSAAGLVAGSLHAVLAAVAPWLMIVVAAAIVVVGAIAAAGRTISLRGLHVTPRWGTGPGFVPMIGFGIAYAVGSLSCSLPVFIAAVGGALTSGSAVVTTAVVIAYGLGMGLLAIVLALVASFAGSFAGRSARSGAGSAAGPRTGSAAGSAAPRAPFARLRRSAAWLPRTGGVLCIAIGLYLAAYWIAQLGGPQLVQPVTLALDAAQQWVVAGIEAVWLPLGAAAVVLVAAALAVAARRSRPATPAVASTRGMRREDAP